MDPTPDRFRALARSSPWRWSTLRYVVTDRSATGDASIRVWLRRPDLARVEDLAGGLLGIHRAEPRTSVALTWGDPAPPRPLHVPSHAAPTLDGEGLVSARPDRWDLDTDAPMYGNYYDVAMLDPVELADGHDGGPAATIGDLRAVDHHGREAWEAVLRPTSGYEPRCECCALLFSEAFEEVGFGPRVDDPTFAYPDANLVRLDVGTGVCVRVRQLGGGRDGAGHDVEIEAVDEPMADERFDRPTSRRRWRRPRGDGER